MKDQIQGCEDLQETTQMAGASSLPTILVVDDDPRILKQIQWALADQYQLFLTTERQPALELFKKNDISVVLLDLGLPPCQRDATEGLLALEEMISHNPLVKVIIVSGNSERQNALRAVEKGAFDIFPKPIDIEELGTVLRRAVNRVELEKEAREERASAGCGSIENIIGSSEPMQMVFSTIRRVAGTDVPVLIRGESGTGKELVARAIHNLGPRKDGPFLAINCSAIPETLLENELFGHEKGSFTGATSQRLGKFECAKGGTLFLDEIGDLALELQVKLLRFLQEHVIERVGGRTPISVDSRIIAATNHDLETAVREKRFREDLYFRLEVVRIILPPLRERGNDIVEIARHLLGVFSTELRQPPRRFSNSGLEAIRRYAWPGNIRELQNRLKRALVLSDSRVIGPAELEFAEPPPAPRTSGTSLRDARSELEREIVSKTLREHGGNISKAARALGVSRPRLYELKSRYQL